MSMPHSGLGHKRFLCLRLEGFARKFYKNVRWPDFVGPLPHSLMISQLNEGVIAG